MDISNKIKYLRANIGYSQEMLANAIGISPEEMKTIESGKYGNISAELLWELSDNLGVHISELTYGELREIPQIHCDIGKLHPDDMWIIGFGIMFVKNLHELKEINKR